MESSDSGTRKTLSLTGSCAHLHALNKLLFFNAFMTLHQSEQLDLHGIWTQIAALAVQILIRLCLGHSDFLK